MKSLSLYKIALCVMSFILLLWSLALFSQASLQKQVHNFLYPSQRRILASLETNLNLDARKYKVLKVQSGKEIWIEIYDLKNQDKHPISFKMNAKADGQMFVNNKTSPLFTTDIDGDKILEIIAPTFSLEFQPQVHAFQVDPNSGIFTKITNKKLIELL